MTTDQQTVERTRTADDHWVSGVTKMCRRHDAWAMGLIAQTLDGRMTSATTAEEIVDEVRRDLAATRAECLEQCGTLDEDGR